MITSLNFKTLNHLLQRLHLYTPAILVKLRAGLGMDPPTALPRGSRFPKPELRHVQFALTTIHLSTYTFLLHLELNKGLTFYLPVSKEPHCPWQWPSHTKPPRTKPSKSATSPLHTGASAHLPVSLSCYSCISGKLPCIPPLFQPLPSRFWTYSSASTPD